MSDFKVVGKPVPRADGIEKVTGAAVFLADYPIPGCWVAGTVKSPVARGILRGVRRDPAYRSPALPIEVQHLIGEGLSSEFVHYMRRWPGFVEGGAVE